MIGMKFENGVIIAADNLISYGGTARFPNCNRVMAVNDNTILGCGGDYADFQSLRCIIEQKVIDDMSLDDHTQIQPKSLFNYLTRFLYNKRCDFDPFWLELIVGGVQNNEPFLGHVSIRGKAYESDFIATGYGSHLALPILREYDEKKKADGSGITKDDGIALTKKCMEVLYYRDCRAMPVFNYAIVSNDAKAEVVEKNNVDQNWGLAKLIRGYN